MKLEDTALYKKLATGYDANNQSLANSLAELVKILCQKASERMKLNISQHPQYTLHDDVHLIRVTELMAMVMGNEMLNSLNPIEISILILSAFYHDTGMVMDGNAIISLDADKDYQLFKANWINAHPNYTEIFQRIRKGIKNVHELEKATRVKAELDAALLTEYIRRSHAEFSETYILKEDAAGKEWKIQNVSLAPTVAKICKSHGMSVDKLNDTNGFFHDANILSYSINTVYLSAILRLADILDFDSERTPDTLYKTIHFTNDVSIREWEKHRSITGWKISSDTIRFTAECTHPEYQRAILTFMDWIDHELECCLNKVNAFPSFASNYKLNLPSRVDRTRISPKNDSYIYHDLEFTLSRDEIVKLLMTDELYKSPSLCVRELLQNSLDALCYKKAHMKNDYNVDWNDGIVEFTHSIDEYGREVLTCVDNGIGMDEGIIKKFLTNAGKSYYKSPEFEQENETFKSKGINFEPCSQFGIGFMSCFMIGDLITIKTRKDYGRGKPYGKPLHVEISGLNGIIIIREGEKDQKIGTTVSIIGREKPKLYNEWIDKIRLVDTLCGYALACEFPIKAKCSIEEIASETEINAGCKTRKTFLEKANLPLDSYTTYEQDFTEVNPNTHGKLRVSFLVDDKGALTLANEHATWEHEQKGDSKTWIIKKDGHKIYTHDLTSTCCDGILVCGNTGVDDESELLGWWRNTINLGIESFIVDFRNDIRPRLSPSRIAREDIHNMHHSWKLAQDIADKTQGKLWDKVFQDTTSDCEIKMLMKIATIYEFSLNKLSPEIIKDKLLLPICENGEYEWIKISSISKVILKTEGEKTVYSIGENQTIDIDADTSQYYSGCVGDVRSNAIDALMSIAALEVAMESNITLHILNPRDTKYPIGRQKYDSYIFRTLLLPYWDKSNKYIAISTSFRNVNANHPLTVYAKDKLHFREDDYLVDFFISLIHFVCDKANFIPLNDGKISWAMKHLGCKYEMVDWANVSEECKPNYVVLHEHNDVTLSEKQFVEWANYKGINFDE